MKSIKPNKIFYLSILLLIFFLGCEKSLTQQNKYAFVKENLNNIHNIKELNSFFEKLQYAKQKQLNILHIGDSHLQANDITEFLRDGLQQKFGNAGRGLIVPYKVAGTNSPEDIISQSNNKWEGKRNSKPFLPQSNGIGGITIESVDPNASFIFQLPDKYAFTNMAVFFENDDKSYDIFAEDQDNGQIIDLKKYINKKDKNVAIVSFTKSTTKVKITSVKSDSKQNHITILGINTSNNKNGLIYHSIGVNGAEYFHFDTSKYFNKETSFLNPDLIIISLGTNEAYRKDSDFNEISIKKEIDSFISNLKKYNPGIPFLITTPAYAYKNGKPNSRLKIIHDILIKYCNEKQLAYWDLQEITGDAVNWKKNNLFSKDLVHYNKEGYKLQGQLLLSAILNSYNDYVAKH